MKSVLFGTPNADSWRLTLDDVSVREQVIGLKGELRAGFFTGLTPMCLAPAILSQFAANLRELDRRLTGSATLESSNQQSAIRFSISVNHVGHIQATGRYEINGNALDFNFTTDQTQLGPFVSWLDAVIHEYEHATA